jgi:hypothetical protein
MWIVHHCSYVGAVGEGEDVGGRNGAAAAVAQGRIIARVVALGAVVTGRAVLDAILVTRDRNHVCAALPIRDSLSSRERHEDNRHN